MSAFLTALRVIILLAVGSIMITGTVMAFRYTARYYKEEGSTEKRANVGWVRFAAVLLGIVGASTILRGLQLPFAPEEEKKPVAFKREYRKEGDSPWRRVDTDEEN